MFDVGMIAIFAACFAVVVAILYSLEKV